jgi:CUB domain
MSTSTIIKFLFCPQFVEFTIVEFATDFPNDVLKIFDGINADAPDIAQLSGEHWNLSLPMKYQTMQQSMFIQFRTDNVQSGLNGFKANYKTVGR